MTGRDAGRGSAPSRLGRMRVLAGFAVAIGIILLASAVAAVLAEPPEPPPDCLPGEACSGPPPGRPAESAGPTESAGPAEPSEPAPSSGTAASPPVDLGVGIRAGVPWRSPELGYEFEYDDDIWIIEREDGRGVELRLDADIDATVVVAAVPASEAGVETLAEQRLEDIRASVPDLAVDTRGRYAILGPGIGFLDGIGGSFAGSVTSPQGATTPVGVSLMAASDGLTTVVITLIVSDPDEPLGGESLQRIVRERAAELIFKTFRWAPTS
jgi:hypothetical protein